MSNYIPLSIPNFEGNEKKYVIDAIEQGWVSTGGEYIGLFERKIAQYIKVEKVVACQSGTSALHLSLIESGISQGDIVLVSPLTFIAAVNPIKYVSAEPLFIDCDDSLCIDAKKLNEFCSEKCVFYNGVLYHDNKAVKAIIVVHVFGNMADMESVMEIAQKYNLKVIEDATEALGTYYTDGKYKGKYAGTIGDFGCFSFNGNKIITTGGGGAITSNDVSLLDHIKYLSTQAKDDPVFYQHNEIGYNYRMTNLQAAVGVGQIEMLDEFIERKRNNYELYSKLFDDYNYLNLLHFRENVYSNMWFYSLLIDKDKSNISINEIIARLLEKGIQTRPVWGLINKQIPYRMCESYLVEKAEYYSDRILNIPSSTQITSKDIQYVVDCIADVL